MSGVPAQSHSQLVEWLDTRLMGKEASKLVGAGYTSLDQLRQCSAFERENSIVPLFALSGQRLKLRVLFDELCQAKKPTPAAFVVPPKSAPAPAPKSLPPVPPTKSTPAAAAAAKPPPLLSKPSIPPPPPAHDDDDDGDGADEDDKQRASIQLAGAQASGAGDDSDEEANRARRANGPAKDKPKPKALPAVPSAGSAAAAAAAYDDDDDDDDDVPPPPVPVAAADTSDPDDYDPTYNAPYMPQNLPDLPDSDAEGPSEEDDELGKVQSQTATAPALSTAAGRSPSVVSPPVGHSKKPSRSNTGPISTSVNAVPITNTKPKQLPAPPPAKKLPATPGAKTDADVPNGSNPSPTHRPSHSDGASAARRAETKAGSTPPAGGVGGEPAVASNTATPRDSTNSVSGSVRGTGAHSPTNSSAATSPGTSPAGSYDNNKNGGSPLLLLKANSTSPTHSPQPSLAIDSPTKSGPSTPIADRIQNMRLAVRAAKESAGDESKTGAAAASAIGGAKTSARLGTRASVDLSSSTAPASGASHRSSISSSGLMLIGGGGSGGGDVPSAAMNYSSSQFPAGSLAGCKDDDHNDEHAAGFPAIDSLGNTAEFFKAGRLEKKGPTSMFNHKEWTPFICVLKDGWLYWIKPSDDEKSVSGMVKILRPSVKIQVSATDSSVLEITDSKPPAYSLAADSGSQPAGASSSGNGTITYLFRAVEGSSAGQTSKHPRLGTLVFDDADGWLHAFRLQRVTAFNKRKPGKDDSKKAALTTAAETERKRRDAAEYTQRGTVFKKFKRGSSKERLIWCSDTCDRLFWGDKKRVVKGYIMLHEFTEIKPGACPGSKKPAQALSLISKSRALELEADSAEDKDRWCAALKLLTGLK